MYTLDGNRTHNLHNFSVTALPVELPSPSEQSGEFIYKCWAVYALLYFNRTPLATWFWYAWEYRISEIVWITEMLTFSLLFQGVSP